MLGVLPIFKCMSMFVPDVPVSADSGRWKPVVRGFSEGVEVLSERGWVRLDSFLGSDSLGERVGWVGNGWKVGNVVPKDSVFGFWETGVSFPRLGSVDPSTGEVVFVKPSMFQWFDYDGWLVHVKGRGVDFLCSLFTDLWLHPRYARGFKYVVAGDVVRNRAGAAKYGMLNKFNVDMYGDWSPERYLGEQFSLSASGVTVPALRSGLQVDMEHPFVVTPKSHASRVRVWDKYWFESLDVETGRMVRSDRVRDKVGVFNVVIPPFHNLIVRWGRVNDNPRTRWVGGPVVVGDGLDKSLLRVDGVLRGGRELGGSYSVL